MSDLSVHILVRDRHICRIHDRAPQSAPSTWRWPIPHPPIPPIPTAWRSARAAALPSRSTVS